MGLEVGRVRWVESRIPSGCAHGGTSAPVLSDFAAPAPSFERRSCPRASEEPKNAGGEGTEKPRESAASTIFRRAAYLVKRPQKLQNNQVATKNKVKMNQINKYGN